MIGLALLERIEVKVTGLNISVVALEALHECFLIYLTRSL